MYALDLICSNGHQFESWFKSRAAFEEQLEAKIVSCPQCSDMSIKQILTPIRIGKHADREERPETKPKPSDNTKLMEIIERHFEDVGRKFPDEALKIHLGETERRGIRGTATPDEERELKEEGVPFFKIPDFQ